MDLALVANAASGSGTDVDDIGDGLRRHGARVSVIDVCDLDPWLESGASPETARSLVGDAERVVVCGGDGSVGAAAALAAACGRPLAVIPTGTANDFARHLDLPLDPAQAAAIACDPDARLRPMDLAWTGSTPFVNAASAGLSVEAAGKAAPLKPRLGPLAYPIGAAAAAVGGKPFRCSVICDGEPCFEGEAWQVTVAGTGAFGGGSEIDAADPRDGELDVAILEAGPKARLVRHAVGMRSGTLTDQKGVVHLRGKRIEVSGPGDWNVDGEERTLDAASFRVQLRALDVVVGS